MAEHAASAIVNPAVHQYYCAIFQHHLYCFLSYYIQAATLALWKTIFEKLFFANHYIIPVDCRLPPEKCGSATWNISHSLTVRRIARRENGDIR